VLVNIFENINVRGSGLLADHPPCEELPITRTKPQNFGYRRLLKREREREREREWKCSRRVGESEKKWD
jgi:hypothetical protein